MNDNPYGITREEILNLAAQKVANDFCAEETIEGQVEKLLQSRIATAIAANLAHRIDAFLDGEMAKLMATEICPVDIWGAKTGNPTTLRAALAARAKTYWDERVDESGKPSTSYSAKPRHEFVFRKIANDEFNKAIRQNVEGVIGAFKDAVATDLKASVEKQINELIKTTTPTGAFAQTTG